MVSCETINNSTNLEIAGLYSKDFPDLNTKRKAYCPVSGSIIYQGMEGTRIQIKAKKFDDTSYMQTTLWSFFYVS
jgi:hypothetical protein